MTVIPAAHTGGAARKVWQSMMEHLESHRVGQRRVDPQQFNDLASADFETALGAAVKLICTGLFLPSADGPELVAPHSYNDPYG